jgi:hypothetical protein
VGGVRTIPPTTRPHIMARIGLVAAVAFFVAASASARPLLRIGQPCSAKLQTQYKHAGLVCVKGRLAKLAKPKTATTTRQLPPAGTRSNPVPLNTPGSLGNGWTLTVTSVNADATSAILAAGPGNAAPLAGYRYVLVTVTAVYNGPGSSHLTPGTSFRAMGTSNVEHTTSNSFCGALPPPDLDVTNPLVQSGGSESGYAACWMVPAADVPSLELYYEPLLATSAVWFALH